MNNATYRKVAEINKALRQFSSALPHLTNPVNIKIYTGLIKDLKEEKMVLIKNS